MELLNSPHNCFYGTLYTSFRTCLESDRKKNTFRVLKRVLDSWGLSLWRYEEIQPPHPKKVPVCDTDEKLSVREYSWRKIQHLLEKAWKSEDFRSEANSSHSRNSKNLVGSLWSCFRDTRPRSVCSRMKMIRKLLNATWNAGKSSEFSRVGNRNSISKWSARNPNGKSITFSKKIRKFTVSG